MPASRKKAYLLVIFGVFMVSYSGPMVKGALLQGATPITIAFLRMLSAGLLLLPFSLRKRPGESYSSLGRYGMHQSGSCCLACWLRFFWHCTTLHG